MNDVQFFALAQVAVLALLLGGAILAQSWMLAALGVAGLAALAVTIRSARR